VTTERAARSLQNETSSPALEAVVNSQTQVIMATATLTKAVKKLLFDVNGNFNMDFQSTFDSSLVAAYA
jgi:CRISPR/Cas system-associated endonuclease/helicase Cas3